MMQQSPRLYVSPHACPLRVAALPLKEVNLPWGGPADDCQPPRSVTACTSLPPPAPFALSLSKGFRDVRPAP